MKQIDVLIIEDSFFSADLNVREIKRAGFKVQHQIVASKKTMQEALRYKPWDVIISDNYMPGFSALQALDVRNQEGCKTPFIIVSEVMLDKEIKTAMKDGCHAYITKERLGTLGQQLKQIFEVPDVR